MNLLKPKYLFVPIATLCGGSFCAYQTYKSYFDENDKKTKTNTQIMESWSLINFKSYGVLQKKHGYLLIPSRDLTDPVHKVVENKVKCQNPIITNVQTFLRPINSKIGIEIATNTSW